MPAEFDPEEFSPEFQRLWSEYCDARKVRNQVEGPVGFRAPGQNYGSGKPMTTAEYAAARDRVERARRALEEYCDENGIPYPPFD